MIRGLLALVFMVCALEAMAGDTVTMVANVVKSKKSERLLVLSTADGRVYKTDRTDEMNDYLLTFKDRYVNISWTEVAGERIITRIDPINQNGLNSTDKAESNYFTPSATRATSTYVPTDVGSLEKAKEIFAGMNEGDKGRSQCFKRAHVWSFDMWRNLGVKSQKIFIFYTPRYQELTDPEWWFHVAPMVVAGGVEYVMDKTFMEKKGPVTVRQWVDYFMNKNITCPVIDNYYNYRLGTDGKDYYPYKHNVWSRLCYLTKTPMYHFRPMDFQPLAKSGKEKTGWVLSELMDARYAFKDWGDDYEALDTGLDRIKY